MYGDLNILVININLLIFIISENGKNITNTRSNINILSINIKTFLLTFFLSINNSITEKQLFWIFSEVYQNVQKNWQ